MNNSASHRHVRPDSQGLSLRRLERASRIFKAAGEPRRLQLLHLLARKTLCVSELALATDEEVPSVSQRLKVLMQEGLVDRTRDGRHVHYALRDRHILDLIDNALRHSEESPKENL